MFKNFYLAKHSGRILTLQPSAGTADLNALFFRKKKGEGEDEGAAGGSEGGKAKKHILIRWCSSSCSTPGRRSPMRR